MGRIWRIIMVLLSTLAALVIIVHSAEEEYEAQYSNRREMRPRMLDTGAPRIYEQPWRTMDMEPVVQHTTPDDLWIANSSGEPPRRRKSGRKRRRRPETSSEELTPRYATAEENVRPYFDVTADRNEEDTPKRRRKKQEPRPGRRDSEREEEDRPIRRRGQRRKRPVETWPAFSEFSEYHAGPVRELELEVATVAPLITVDSDYRDIDNNENKRPVISDPGNYRQPLAEDIGILINTGQDAKNDPITFERKENETQYETDKRNDASSLSMSEFSAEESNPIFVPNSDNDNTINNLKSKARSKAADYFKGIEKAQLARNAENTGAIDPFILKDILKKSNGTSLSEILQQNNLTLADLLRGREEVLSVLKSDKLQSPLESIENVSIPILNKEARELSGENLLQNSETKYVTTIVNGNEPTTDQNIAIELTTEVDGEQPISEKPKVEEASLRPTVRRFPTASRRKQRIRPMLNSTYKSQLSRDMIALNARKYFNSRRRNNQEWKEHVPMMKKNIGIESVNKKLDIETTTTYLVEETTIQEVENCTKVDEPENEQNNAGENFDDIEVITVHQKIVDEVDESDKTQRIRVNVTDKPLVQSTTTPFNASGLRRQAFNNRLKKKRLKQKTLLTTEAPEDDIRMDLFGIPNLVSSSEFIAQTARPISTHAVEIQKTSLDDVTILEDFITTELPHRRNRKKNSKSSLTRASTTTRTIFQPESTEETAKIEIEEIFNDTQTSQTLARILKERNMSLSELVEHRERGSSHVHLADIFHNASREPNPPEPFLSKSLIEPISKETYPLRALLDANNHDTTAKSPTTDPQTEENIPVFMNFGNNVNENAENMGIMSLFHNITRNDTVVDSEPALKKDSQGTLYETSITIVNTTDSRNENNTIRESRVLHVLNDNQDDVVSWNEIFSLMRKNYENQSEEITTTPTNGLLPAEKIKRPTLEEDLDGDGVIVLEDLQHLKDFDSHIASASNENLDFNTYQRAEGPTTKAPGFLDKLPSQTRSVTVATASIAGLAMVLFLLTYVGYRWQQQRTMTRKKSFSGERVPTPVFENRKGSKNNSSSRSISPMLSSNIYTLNTLDSRNGKESPDYMWDSLRKPFQ